MTKFNSRLMSTVLAYNVENRAIELCRIKCNLPILSNTDFEQNK